MTTPHIRIPGSCGLAQPLGFPLSPRVSGVGALDWSCSRVLTGLSHPASEDVFNCRLSGSWITAAVGGGLPVGCWELRVPRGDLPLPPRLHADPPPSAFMSFFLNQQGTAGLVRPSLARLSLLDSCSHCDASGHVTFAPLEPSRGLGPPTSHRWAWPSNLVYLPVHRSSVHLPIPGAGPPSSPGRLVSKLDLYT